MIDETVYLATLFLGEWGEARTIHIAAVTLPPLLLGLGLYRANKFLAAVGFSTLHLLLYVALCKFTKGGYAYFLYEQSSRVAGGGYVELMAPTMAETALLFGLPPLIHSLAVPTLGVVLWRTAVKGRRS